MKEGKANCKLIFFWVAGGNTEEDENSSSDGRIGELEDDEESDDLISATFVTCFGLIACLSDQASVL